MTRYRTIVADPPWAYPGGFGTVPDRPFPGKRDAGSDKSGTFVKRPIPYETLNVTRSRHCPSLILPTRTRTSISGRPSDTYMMLRE
jgi:hypothetical protein